MSRAAIRTLVPTSTAPLITSATNNPSLIQKAVDARSLNAWASIYANSAAIRSGVAFGHVGALLGGGGCAIAADLWTLKASRRPNDSVQTELERLHARWHHVSPRTAL